MKRHRVWIEIVVLGTAIACALAILLATFGAVAGAAVGASSPQTASPASAEQSYEGIVTCTHCGARHPAELGQTAAICVRTCVHGGASFALVNAESTYLLDGDRSALKKLAGQRAHVVGNRSGKTIRVTSVVAES